MSFFAGVYACGASVTPHRETFTQLERALGRDWQNASKFSDERLLLTHVDLNVLGSPGYLQTEVICVLAGELLLAFRDQKPRAEDVGTIATAY
jgi:hypothetical protein